MTPLRISAVITAYNCAQFLDEAIESVLAQTRPPDEIVVVDDESTDDTPAIAERYAPRGVRLVRKTNGGPSSARNVGIAATTGDAIALLDCDDVWLPNKIELQAAVLDSRPEVGVVSADIWWWNVQKNTRRVHRYRVGFGRDLRFEALIHNVVGCPSVLMFRRSTIEAIGNYNVDMYWGEDWEFGIRAAWLSNVAFVPQPLITYRRHESSRSHFRKWEHVSALLDISRQTIRRYAPPQWRWLLVARALSKTEWQRAYFAIEDGLPAAKCIGYALRGLLWFPFENTASKLKLLGRAALGEKTTVGLKRVLKQTREEL